VSASLTVLDVRLWMWHPYS